MGGSGEEPGVAELFTFPQIVLPTVRQGLDLEGSGKSVSILFPEEEAVDVADLTLVRVGGETLDRVPASTHPLTGVMT